MTISGKSFTWIDRRRELFQRFPGKAASAPEEADRSILEAHVGLKETGSLRGCIKDKHDSAYYLLAEFRYYDAALF